MDHARQSTRDSASTPNRRRNQQPRGGAQIYPTPQYNFHQSVFARGGFEEGPGLCLIDAGLPSSEAPSQSASITVSSASMHPDQYWAVNTPPSQGNLLTAPYGSPFYTPSMSMPVSASTSNLPIHPRSRFSTGPHQESYYPIHGLPIASDSTYDPVHPSSTIAPGASSDLIYQSSLGLQDSSNWYPGPEPYNVTAPYNSAQELDQTTPRASEFNKNIYPQRRSPVKRERQRPLAASRSHSASSAGSVRSQAPFLCNICNKEFATQSTLKSHQRSHDQDRKKEYICRLALKNGEICGKAFLRRTDLTRHEKTNTHRNTKDFKCGYNCGAESNRKDTIDRHMRDVCAAGPRYGRKVSGSGGATPTGESSSEESELFSSPPVGKLADYDKGRPSRH